MEIADIIPHVEALIFASDHPLPAIEILDFLNQSKGFLEDQVNINQVTTSIDAIREKYTSEFYAFEVVQSGGGFQFLTKPDYHATVARLNGDKYLKRLSKASLETLAIIAYKQPVTKSDIESIRGVNSDYSVQKLLEKELVAIKGRKEDAPGKPLLYVTSESFMDYFGLNSPDELPKVKEIRQEDVSQPTLPPVNQPIAERLKEARILLPGEVAEKAESGVERSVAEMDVPEMVSEEDAPADNLSMEEEEELLLSPPDAEAEVASEEGETDEDPEDKDPEQPA